MRNTIIQTTTNIVNGKVHRLTGNADPMQTPIMFDMRDVMYLYENYDVNDCPMTHVVLNMGYEFVIYEDYEEMAQLYREINEVKKNNC